MAYEGFVCLAGTTLVNNARTAAYAAKHGVSVRCSGCADLAEAIEGNGFPGYASPDADPAPWYDPSVPESKGFSGLLGLEIVGAGKGTAGSSWTDLLTDGAVPGPLRRSAREIQIRAVAIAIDDASLSYGLAWLASALRGDQCRSCGGDELVLFAACPTTGPVDAASCLTEPPVPQPPVDKPFVRRAGDPTARGDQLQRQLFDVMLLEGPETTAKHQVSGGILADVTFTLKAGVPYWYRLPVVVSSDTTTPPEPPWFWTGSVNNWNSDEVWDLCEQERVTQYCLNDPLVGQVLPGCVDPSPPPVPVPPVDPCYPGGFYTAAFRTVIRTEQGAVPDWLEKTPVVTISPGSSALRRLTLRFYTNPLELPAGPDIDPCTACAQVSIAYLPPGSTLTIDGRVNRAHVDCGGNRVAEPVLYGPKGQIFEWPILECSTSMFVEWVLDARWPPARDMTFSVQLAGREDAC